ncbi:ring-h2 finger protein atl47 [Quercus suber]|uniref:Ring-h2 finger protein atl47 n=1 Tax=Quercus suber TaxID=58331 RepID=A0AAW0MI18_QUESU|nr:ring-h2 finger protein atl47 [Quercus suber]
MGTFQYVVDDSNLQVALSDGNSVGNGGSNVKHFNERRYLAKFSDNGDVEGKKISGRIKGENFFVSKIWLWSKKKVL